MKIEKPYQPSEDEMRAGEEMMTDTQRAHSSLREKAYNNLSPEMLTALENGSYDLKREVKRSGNPTWHGVGKEIEIIRGTVGEKKIDVRCTTNYTERGIDWESNGSVNGEKVSENLASEIFRKYDSVSKIQDIGTKGVFGIGKRGSIFAREAQGIVQQEEDEKQRLARNERAALEKEGEERLGEMEARANQEREDKIKGELI